MKKTWLLAPVVAALLLAACGNDNVKEDDAESKEKVESSADPKLEESKEENNVGKTEESELGKSTIEFQNKKLNKSFKNGPVKLELAKIQSMTLEPSESYKEAFDGKKKVTVITVEMKAENTIEDTTNFYPDQATLTTDTGEQVDANLVFSDNIGGEFLGKIKKAGNVIFVLDSEAKDIGKVTIHINAPSNESFESLGDKIKVDIPFK